MSTMDSLAERIRAKNTQRVQQEQRQTQRIREWVGDIAELFKRIEWWLEPLRKQGLIAISQGEIEVRESPYEEKPIRYVAPTLRLEIGTSRVFLSPEAGFVLGGEAVVTVTGLAGYQRIAIYRARDEGSVSWVLKVIEHGKPTKREGQPFDEAALAALLESAI